MLTKGGSRLGGSVGSDYKIIDSLSLEEKASRISQALDDLNIDGIIATGGDTSMNLIAQMLQGSPKGRNIPFVGIPKSIDNDVPRTMYSLGFQSAVSVAAKAISSVRDTAESHRRVIVVECMGRDAGFLTLHSGLAGGADAILLPEFPIDNDALLNHVQTVYNQHKCAVVAVSESIRLPQSGETATYTTADGKTRLGGSAEAVARFISESLDLDARHVVLGHTQRGGSPNAFDQVMATTLGVHAVNAICSGQSKVMMVWNGQAVECISLDKLANEPSKSVTVDYHELVAARCMGVYCGTLP
jgi:6-phosphofructokinase